MAKHDIGQVKRDEAAATKSAIDAWFKANPYGRQQECATDLGLSVMTVSRHCKVLRQEHRQQQVSQAASA